MSRRGLGRGLTAIIPDAASTEIDSLSAEQRLFQQLVDSGFDLLDELVAPSIVAYLHAPHDDEPTLSLRRPALGSLTPTRGFRLFHQIAEVTNRGADEGPFEFEGSRGRFFRTAGPSSDGLHVAAGGQLDDPDTDIDRVRQVCQAFGRVCHQFHQPADRSSKPRLVIEVEDGKTTVEATLSDLDELRIGRASSDSALEAVARAVLDAWDLDHTVTEVRDVPIDRERAVLVVLAAVDGSVHLGLARSADDAAHTCALATLRAISDD